MQKEYLTVITKHGRQLVLTPFFLNRGYLNKAFGRGTYPEPNFLNTGLALCGILLPDETISEFISRYEINHIKNLANANLKMP